MRYKIIYKMRYKINEVYIFHVPSSLVLPPRTLGDTGHSKSFASVAAVDSSFVRGIVGTQDPDNPVGTLQLEDLLRHCNHSHGQVTGKVPFCKAHRDAVKFITNAAKPPDAVTEVRTDVRTDVVTPAQLLISYNIAKSSTLTLKKQYERDCELARRSGAIDDVPASRCGGQVNVQAIPARKA